jgi:hypothetical protein
MMRALLTDSALRIRRIRSEIQKQGGDSSNNEHGYEPIRISSSGVGFLQFIA